jgi:hypothetical protein
MVARVLVALLVAALIAVPFEAPALVNIISGGIPGNGFTFAVIAVPAATSVTVPTFLRFADLKARGIVPNWPTLTRWIETQGFPPGRLLGPNIRAWTADEVADWLGTRPTGRQTRQHADDHADDHAA